MTITSVNLVAGQWTLIGAGPMAVSLSQTDHATHVDLLAASSQPALGATPDNTISGLYESVFYSSTSQVWGIVRAPGVGATVNAIPAGESSTSVVTTNLAVKSLWDFLTPTQIAAVKARNFAVDCAPQINVAFSSGYAIHAPKGGYGCNSQLVIPQSGIFYLSGEGNLTEFRLMSSITVQCWKDGLDVSGATIDPVFISDVFFNANRNANICLRVGASKGGVLTNVNTQNFLVVGTQVGDDSGAATARYYENHINHLTCDGGNGYSGGTAGVPTVAMATTGLLITNTATDNEISNIAAAYITTAGIDVFGSTNQIHNPHAYGNNTSQTGPMYCVRANAPCRITDPECDNVTVAGIDINSQNVSITGGLYYWSVGNTPTTWSSGTPSIGQAVPIQIESGIDTFSIVGGTARGDNSSNPSARWLGSSKPQRGTLLGLSPPRRQPGDLAVNYVERSLGVMRSTGNASAFVLDTVTGQTGLYMGYVNGKLRFTLGTDGTSESGSNAGSNIVLTTYADDGTTATTALKIYRTGSVQLMGGTVAASASGVGFFGTSPVAKPTITGSRGGNAALASLLTALAGMGQITDSSTA